MSLTSEFKTHTRLLILGLCFLAEVTTIYIDIGTYVASSLRDMNLPRIIVRPECPILWRVKRQLLLMMMNKMVDIKIMAMLLVNEMYAFVAMFL